MVFFERFSQNFAVIYHKMRSTTGIVQDLARGKVVEGVVLRIAKTSTLSFELKDLCQMAYMVLLKYDNAKLLGAEEGGYLVPMITKIVKNLANSHGGFTREIREFSRKCNELCGDEE